MIINVQKLYSYLFLFISLFTTGAFLYPVAKIVEVSTGFPLHWCIIVLGLIIILYTTAGGLWAVIVTDVLQFIILTAAVLIIVPLAFQKVDGTLLVPAHPVSGLLAGSPENLSQARFTKYIGEYCAVDNDSKRGIGLITIKPIDTQ